MPVIASGCLSAWPASAWTACVVATSLGPATPCGRTSSADSAADWLAIVSRSSKSVPRPKSGSVNSVVLSSVSTQVMANSSAMRVSIAPPKPHRRALARRSSGSLLVRMAMKTMLSIPSTTSNSVSVSSETSAATLKTPGSKNVRARSGMADIMRKRPRSANQKARPGGVRW